MTDEESNVKMSGNYMLTSLLIFGILGLLVYVGIWLLYKWWNSNSLPSELKNQPEGLLDEYMYSQNNRTIIAKSKMDAVSDACLVPIIILYSDNLELYAQHMKAKKGRLDLDVASMEQLISQTKFHEENSFRPLLEKINVDLRDVGEERELRNKLVVELAKVRSVAVSYGSTAIDLYKSVNESKRNTDIVIKANATLIYFLNLVTSLKSRTDKLISLFFCAPFIDIDSIQKIQPLVSKLTEYYKPLMDEMRNVKAKDINDSFITRKRSLVCACAYETGAIFQTIYEILHEARMNTHRRLKEKITVLDPGKRKIGEELLDEVEERYTQTKVDYDVSISCDLDRFQGSASMHTDYLKRNKDDRATNKLETVRDDKSRKGNTRDFANVLIKEEEENYSDHLSFSLFFLDFMENYVSSCELPERWKFIIGKLMWRINKKTYESFRKFLSTRVIDVIQEV